MLTTNCYGTFDQYEPKKGSNESTYLQKQRGKAICHVNNVNYPNLPRKQPIATSFNEDHHRKTALLRTTSTTHLV